MIVYKGRLLKKHSNQKSKLVLSTLIATWFSNITFYLRPIWLQTLVAIDLELCQISFPSFCAPPTEIAVLYCLTLSRRPFLRQVVENVNLDLLLCTGFDNFDSEHAALFLCPIFTQRPMTDGKIEQSYGRSFSLQQLLANFSPYFISHEKKSDLSWPEIYKAFKHFWLSNWFSIARVVACFLQESLSLLAATAAYNETLCVCARPSDQPKQCLRAAPRAWPLILPSEPLNRLPDDRQGLKLGLKLELCHLTNELY